MLIWGWCYHNSLVVMMLLDGWYGLIAVVGGGEGSDDGIYARCE